MSKSIRTENVPVSTLSAPFADTTTIDEACRWLSDERPTLDEVANRLRHLQAVHGELGDVIRLLRQHAMGALGDWTGSSAFCPDETPF
jgi:hypothetical protein